MALYLWHLNTPPKLLLLEVQQILTVSFLIESNLPSQQLLPFQMLLGEYFIGTHPNKSSRGSANLSFRYIFGSGHIAYGALLYPKISLLEAAKHNYVAVRHPY